jgi:hypothetical protein
MAYQNWNQSSWMLFSFRIHWLINHLSSSGRWLFLFHQHQRVYYLVNYTMATKQEAIAPKNQRSGGSTRDGAKESPAWRKRSKGHSRRPRRTKQVWFLSALNVFLRIKKRFRSTSYLACHDLWQGPTIDSVISRHVRKNKNVSSHTGQVYI